MQVFEAAGDDRGLMEAWSAIAHANHGLCHYEARGEAFNRAAVYAARCGDEAAANKYKADFGIGYVFGPAPVEEGIAWHENAPLDHSWAFQHLGIQAMLEAMRGRIRRCADVDCRLPGASS